MTYLSFQDLLGQLSLVLGQGGAFRDAPTSGGGGEGEWHLELPQGLLEMLLHSSLSERMDIG